VPTEPTAAHPVPDIVGMQIAHRVMLRDLERTTSVARDMARGDVPATRRRVRAFVRHVDLMIESVHHHHLAEDEILWPVIEQRAGAHIDLAALTEDHEALGPVLSDLRDALGRFASDPGRSTAGSVATCLEGVRSLLVEHIAEEERDTFPVIRRYLSLTDWRDVETRIRAAGARMSFELPRVAAEATPDEMARLRAGAGPMIGLLLAVVSPRYRRREKAIWG
jgi:hemerythrin-like domain-containing protein